MSRAQAYVDLMTAFEAAKALWTDFTLAVDYPGRQTVNIEGQELPYLDLEIEFLDGSELEVGKNTPTRTIGVLLMMIGTKENDGALIAQRIADHFSSRMQVKRLGIVETRAAEGARIRRRAGWRYTPCIIPFWFVDQPA